MLTNAFLVGVSKVVSEILTFRRITGQPKPTAEEMYASLKLTCPSEAYFNKYYEPYKDEIIKAIDVSLNTDAGNN